MEMPVAPRLLALEGPCLRHLTNVYLYPCLCDWCELCLYLYLCLYPYLYLCLCLYPYLCPCPCYSHPELNLRSCDGGWLAPPIVTYRVEFLAMPHQLLKLSVDEEVLNLCFPQLSKCCLDDIAPWHCRQKALKIVMRHLAAAMFRRESKQVVYPAY